MIKEKTESRNIEQKQLGQQLASFAYNSAHLHTICQQRMNCMQIRPISYQSERINLRNKNNQRIIQEIGYCLMASGVVLVKLNSPVNDLAPGSVTRVVCGG